MLSKRRDLQEAKDADRLQPKGKQSGYELARSISRSTRLPVELANLTHSSFIQRNVVTPYDALV